MRGLGWFSKDAMDGMLGGLLWVLVWVLQLVVHLRGPMKYIAGRPIAGKYMRKGAYGFQCGMTGLYDISGRS